MTPKIDIANLAAHVCYSNWSPNYYAEWAADYDPHVTRAAG